MYIKVIIDKYSKTIAKCILKRLIIQKSRYAEEICYERNEYRSLRDIR